MNIRIEPSKLSGKVLAPSAKNISHRMLICSALADGTSVIKNLLECDDTAATAGILTAMGAKITKENDDTVVQGIGKKANRQIFADCFESGSTLRFLIPVAAALGCDSIFSGRAKLPERPITPYFTELSKKGIVFETKTMPYKFSGQLKAGTYTIAGDISSQFISGLLFALPLLDGDSEIVITTPLQSKSYVDITVKALNDFGVIVEKTDKGFFVKGKQKYKSCNTFVEADMSNAAFYVVANAIGSNIEIDGLNKDSMQGDKAIIDIVEQSKGTAFDVDASQIPDIVPILAVLATFSKGVSHITNCGRLRLKECDRLAVTAQELNKLGAKITENSDSLTIEGVDSLHGGICDAYVDHRIAMSLTIASTRATEPVIINGAECVSKSYPKFFEDFKSLGGKTDVIND